MQQISSSASAFVSVHCPVQPPRSIIYTLLFIWSEIDINFRSSHHVSSVVSIDECSPNIEEQWHLCKNAAWMQMCEKVAAFYIVTMGKLGKVNEWIEMDVKMITNF